MRHAKWIHTAVLGFLTCSLLSGSSGCGAPSSNNTSDNTGGSATGGMNGAGGNGSGGNAGGGGTVEPGELLTPGRNTTEFVLSGESHPQKIPLVTRIYLPDGTSPLDDGQPFRVAFGYHGSGGLNREPDQPGDECTQELETKYQEMTDFLLAQGLAVIWIDSFYSRDPRFCEDNSSDFQQFAPPYMDSDLQQVISRLYDTVFAETAFCSMKRFDCTKYMRIGTSEGGTASLLPTHRYLDHSLFQLFDPNSSKNKLDKLTLISYSPLPDNRPEPSFVMPISPGCGFQAAIPFSIDGDSKDLFYPSQHVYLELGSTDGIPNECAVALGDGRRQLQAEEIQKRETIAAEDYRYHLTVYAGAGHPLWEERTAEIKAKLEPLVKTLLP